MKTSITKLPKSQTEIVFEISAEELHGFFEKAMKELAKDSEIKGFRKGKIPKQVVIEKFGKEKILAAASEIAIRESYTREINEKNIEAISQPEISIITPLKLGQNFSFKAKISILPEVNLPEYKKIAGGSKRRKVIVKDKEIEDSLLWLQKSRSKFILKNEPCQIKDFVEIDFSSPQIENNLKRQDGFILGEGRFIKGFEDQLVNMSANEEKTFSLKFPEENKQKELAGKEVNFEVKMKSVQRVIPPEINDDFAKSLGKFQNLKELRDSIKEGIIREKENQESQRLQQEILDKIVRETKLDTPQILIESEKKRTFEDFKKIILAKLEIPFKDYLTKVKKTEKEILDTFTKEAEKKVRNFLVLREIAKKEEVQVSEEEVEGVINEVLKHYKTVEKAEKELDLEQLKIYYKNVIRNEKTLKLIENFATK